MDTSFGIKGGPLENSFGFRLNLENFQCAKSNIEVMYIWQTNKLIFKYQEINLIFYHNFF